MRDPWGEFQGASHELGRAFLEWCEPVVVPVLEWLTRVLDRWERTPMAETRITKADKETQRYNMPKGTWLRIISDGRVSARMSCPGCGSTGTLTLHEIDHLGNVTPSVDCEECDYHESGLVLVGWEG